MVQWHDGKVTDLYGSGGWTADCVMQAKTADSLHRLSNGQRELRHELAHLAHAKGTNTIEESTSSVGTVGASLIAVASLAAGAAGTLLYKNQFSAKKSGLYADLV